MTAGWYYRALTWVGDHPDTRQVAEQLKERRVIRGVPRPLGVSKFPGGVVTLEWRRYLGDWDLRSGCLGNGLPGLGGPCESGP